MLLLDSADDLKFIVAEAAGAGVKVAAHAQTERGARNAIEAKVASVEHAWYVTDEDLALAKNNGVIFVTTDFTVRELKANGMTEAEATRVHKNYVERLRRVYRAGVTVASICTGRSYGHNHKGGVGKLQRARLSDGRSHR